MSSLWMHFLNGLGSIVGLPPDGVQMQASLRDSARLLAQAG